MSWGQHMGMHFIDKCKHGVVVRQCRCADPNKVEHIVACPATCAIEYPETAETPEEIAPTTELPSNEALLVHERDDMLMFLRRTVRSLEAIQDEARGQNLLWINGWMSYFGVDLDVLGAYLRRFPERE